jgi:hypothetical protein
MTYHGGDVVGSPTVYTIFWLPPGYHFDTQGDTGYENLINQFLHDLSGSSYYNVLTQYSKDEQGQPVQGGPILDQVNFGGSYVDTTAFPHAGTQADPVRGSDVIAAVTRDMTTEGWVPGPPNLFLVYVPAGVQVCFGGHFDSVFAYGPYCTFNTEHEAFCGDRDFSDMSGGRAFIAMVTSEGCGPPDLASPNHDPQADQAVRWTDFNLVEHVTNPTLHGWYSLRPTGGEVADDCGMQAHTLNGHTYLLDGLWDNTVDDCGYSTPPTVIGSLRAKSLAPHATQTLSLTTAPKAQVVTKVTYANGTTKVYAGKTNAAGKYRKSWRVPKVKGHVDVDIQVTTSEGAVAALHKSFRVR